jgi:hypothetical protein
LEALKARWKSTNKPALDAALRALKSAQVAEDKSLLPPDHEALFLRLQFI